jgi:hypothetical protein
VTAKARHWYLSCSIKANVNFIRTGHEATEECRYNSTLSFTSELDGGGCSTSLPGRLTPRKVPVPNMWSPGPVWTGTENIAPTGIRSPDRPGRSKSLYRLSYPGPSLSYSIPVQSISLINIYFNIIIPFTSRSFIYFMYFQFC